MNRPIALSSPRRRALLKWAASTGLLAAVERNFALAQSAPDYRALVCVFLPGGNDGENTLVRYDGAGYQAYAAVRTTASGINIPQGQLLPVQPARGGPPYGFHPACAPLQSLFNNRKLAVVANVGMLAQPSTKSGLETQKAPRPANLFSHTDQERGVQSGDWTGQTHSGWGGRIADRLDPANPGTLFPPLVSVSGLRTFVGGNQSVPLTVPPGSSFSLQGAGPGQFQFDSLRDAALREVLARERRNTYDLVAQVYAEEGMAAASVVSPILQNQNAAVRPFFGGLTSYIASQLRTIALVIEGRAQTQMRRQVFFATQGGYDTHSSQAGQHNTLLGDLSTAVKAFHDAMAALGIGGNVTLFIVTEFGRTFKPAANQGTDHGWGNYAFVVGGSVRGGDFYGAVPTMALNGPDDFGKEGRWIPTTSIEQYGATLARWLGMAEGDLSYIFPNIGAFPNTNLGFMA